MLTEDRVREIFKEELKLYFEVSEGAQPKPQRAAQASGPIGVEGCGTRPELVEKRIVDIFENSRLSWLHFRVIKAVYFAEWDWVPHDTSMFSFLREMSREDGPLDYEEWSTNHMFKLKSRPRKAEFRSSETPGERLGEIEDLYKHKELSPRVIRFLMCYQKNHRLDKIKVVMEMKGYNIADL